MYINFTPPSNDSIRAEWGTTVAPCPPEARLGYRAPIIRKFDARYATGCAKKIRVSAARFDVPSLAHYLSSRYAAGWNIGQFCLVPMQRFCARYDDPDTAASCSERWEVSQNDSGMFTAAAIWAEWEDPTNGQAVDSFSILTIATDDHAINNNVQRRVGNEQSLVVIPQVRRSGWLHATPQAAADSLLPFATALFQSDASRVRIERI